MNNLLVAARPEPPPAGAENVLAASLFDMPDLAEPMLRLGGWLLLAIAVALLAAYGIGRMARKRRPPEPPNTDLQP